MPLMWSSRYSAPQVVSSVRSAYFFKPEKLLGDIIKPLVKGVPMDIWAMEKGGRILYDVDPAQVGLNLLTSKEFRSYKQVVRLAKIIAKSPQGEGAYRFKKATLSGRDVNKKAYWQSVILYGTPWRLVGIHLEQDAAKEGAGASCFGDHRRTGP